MKERKNNPPNNPQKQSKTIKDYIAKKRKMKTWFVKPKNELKTKKMRLDVLMPLVSGILSYDKISKGESPKY